MFDKASNKLYVVMEHGDMDLASFFQKMRAKPEILRMLVRPYWIEMLRAVSVLHKKGSEFKISLLLFWFVQILTLL